MQIQIQVFTVHKRFALTISRGTTAQSTNVWLRIEHNGIEGWGEASPFSIGEATQTTEAIARSLLKIVPLLKAVSPLERQRINRIMQTAQLPSGARAALDIALHDWLGRYANLPLWQLWGLERDRIVPTTVTIGINSPDGAQQRVLDWLGRGTVSTPLQGIQALKLKLGNPAGIEADQAMVQAVQQVAPQIAHISVDANGGWNLEQALVMSRWLADRGIAYLEQPLAKGQEGDLPALCQQSPLPNFCGRELLQQFRHPGFERSGTRHQHQTHEVRGTK